jgi:hypothetical protein
MKRPSAAKHPALLVEVLTELGAGRVTEKFISDDQCFVHGETTGKAIVINPAIAVADTCIHEALHAVRPNWAENYVRRTTTWLLRRMSDEQIQEVYAQFQKRAKRARRS